MDYSFIYIKQMPYVHDYNILLSNIKLDKTFWSYSRIVVDLCPILGSYYWSYMIQKRQIQNVHWSEAIAVRRHRHKICLQISFASYIVLETLLWIKAFWMIYVRQNIVSERLSEKWVSDKSSSRGYLIIKIAWFPITWFIKGVFTVLRLYAYSASFHPFNVSEL